MSASSTGIFCLRIYTLYREEWKAKALILSSFYLSVAVQVVMGALATSSIMTLVRFGRTTCVLIGPPPKDQYKMVIGSYLSMIPCEVVILVATYLHARGAKQKRLLHHESAAMPILRRMYQDGAIYFLLAFGLRLFGAIVWLTLPSDFKFVSDLLIYSLNSVISTRFFLGLRELVFRPPVETRHSTALEGSQFVDTYSVALARTRDPDSRASEDIRLSDMGPTSSKDMSSRTR